MKSTVRSGGSIARVLELLLVIVVACTPFSAASQSPDVATEVPPMSLGRFVDDYGIGYRVTRDEWRQADEARYGITEWNVEGRYLLARNGADNPSDAGLWTRIDWVELQPGSEFEWAFCYAIYDAESSEAARAAPATGRGSPRDGCNGYPFSRMKRVTPWADLVLLGGTVIDGTGSGARAPEPGRGAPKR